MNKIVTESLISNIDKVTEFVNEALEANDCLPKAQAQLDIAVDEIFSNIARYSYGEAQGEVEIEVDFKDGFARLVFKDKGIKYNPTENEPPDIKAGVDERKIGGLGIFLVKSLTDKVYYEYSNGKNILTIEKKIN